MLWVYFSVIKK